MYKDKWDARGGEMTDDGMIRGTREVSPQFRMPELDLTLNDHLRPSSPLSSESRDRERIGNGTDLLQWLRDVGYSRGCICWD